MKDRLLGFFDALRQAGLAPSVGETLDAATAVRVAGIDRPVLREALAAALIKDHAERATFDDVFDRYFALPARAGRSRRPATPREGEGSGRGGEGAGRGQPRQEGARGEQPRAEPRAGHRQRARELARRRALAAKPFRDMAPDEIEALEDLVAELGRRLRSRFSRRQRRVRGGRVDMRRTIRRALSRGGVPLEVLFRAPRPGKSDLLALVDVSYSTVTAAEFLLALLAPARRYFRRVTLLAYVDRPCPISFEAGHLVPHEPLDLHARSDFGNVLKLLADRWDVAVGRNTVLLILGDARNNRRPPRADLLARLHQVARRVIWLNPEPVARWNTGDSVMAAYARHSDAVLAAWSPATLSAALAQLALGARAPRPSR
jgi:uncharacterized protein with von Willebrand factor type A (vWA) domain